MIVVMFVAYAPKNDYLYRMAFIYANGALGVSTAAFSNALILHKYDDLIGMMLHAGPLCCMWNVKQITMHQQKHLPESE